MVSTIVSKWYDFVQPQYHHELKQVSISTIHTGEGACVKSQEGSGVQRGGGHDEPQPGPLPGDLLQPEKL